MNEVAVNRQQNRLVTAHLAWRDAARLPVPTHPRDHRAHPDLKPSRSLTTRQTALFNRCDNALSKINRKRSRHPCRPPPPAQILNHLSTDSGTTYRLRLKRPRSRSAAGRGSRGESRSCGTGSRRRHRPAPAPAVNRRLLAIRPWALAQRPLRCQRRRIGQKAQFSAVLPGGSRGKWQPSSAEFRAARCKFVASQSQQAQMPGRICTLRHFFSDGSKTSSKSQFFNDLRAVRANKNSFLVDLTSRDKSLGSTVSALSVR